MVAVLTGWIDAGGAARAAAEAIEEDGTASPIAEFDDDVYVDYRARRPIMELRDGLNSVLNWERITLAVGHDQTGRDVLLLTGPEPDMAWHRFTRAVGELTGDRLTRVPLGYAKDHPAAHYLQFKQFLGSCEYDASLATSRRFYPELLEVLKAVAPLVQFLNGAIEPRLTPAPLPVSEEPRRNPRQIVVHRPVPEPMW